MEFEFHPSDWLAILQQEPVILVLLGGMIGGIALTQTAKLTWYTFNIEVGVRPYRLGATIFATVATFTITDYLWSELGLTTGTGLKHVTSFISAIAAPYTYKAAKALVATRWPNFAAKWGDSTNGNGKKGPANEHTDTPDS